MSRILCLSLLLLASTAPALAQTEEDYYRIETLPIPEGIVLEVGGLATLPGGDLAVATRRGDVWVVENPTSTLGAPSYRLFANGLHEALGLAYRDGALYAAQRGELTRMIDRDGDGAADRFETVRAWPLSGNYHEYSFGPATASDGSFFVTGNVGFFSPEWWRGVSRVPWRGWTMRITPEGDLEPWATGMRSPAGVALVDGEVFYTDNQGDWMGSGALFHLERGDFTGHPAGLRWADRPESPVDLSTDEVYALVDPQIAPEGEDPIKPEDSPDAPTTPLFEVAGRLPAVKTPAVWLPHAILGISTSGLLTDSTKGRFGPFEGQLFVGDQGQSMISRVFLEEVDGVYQGVAFPFRSGFQSGVLRMTWGNDGSMFVGQTARGWGSAGPDPYGLQRLVWTGEVPFEMEAVRAMPDGFEIAFTKPVDPAAAADPGAYQITSFTYKYHPVYGSRVIDDRPAPVRYVEVSDDGLRARLVVDSLRRHYVHEIRAAGVRSADSLSLLHEAGYYTLNRIPAGEKLAVSEEALQQAQQRQAAEPVAEEAGPSPVRVRSGTAEAPATRAAKNPTEMPAAWEEAEEVLVVGTEPGLKYDVERLVVPAGARVALTFANDDDMPHNLVIVRPGTAIQVGEAAMGLGLKAQELSYVPDSDDVLYFTTLQGPASSETIYFTAPEVAGEYTYVCTVPGHFYVMQGVLEVVEE